MKWTSLLAATALGLSGWALLSLWADEGQRPAAPTVRVDATAVAEVRDRPAVVSYADMLERVRPAVVSVHSQRIIRERFPNMSNDPLFRFFFDQPPQGQRPERRQSGLGSGVVVSADGYILTNHHVVEEADELEVALSDNRRLAAKVIGSDPRTDIAVLKVEAKDLPFVTLGDSDRLRVGDVVFALGNPLGVGQTVTMGIVSATGRSIGILRGGYEDFIQTDAAINRGNSGGALIDAAGRVVGINSAIVSGATGGSIGIGFAIPVNLARTIMDSLVTTGEVQRGFLGVNIEDLTSEMAETFGIEGRRGAVVAGLQQDGPADKAGLKLEDVIVSVNGRPIGSAQELRLAIASMLPGSTVTLGILREGKERTLEVRLDRLPEDGLAATGGAANQLLSGVAVQPISDRLRQEYGLPAGLSGLVVTEVADDSPFGQFFPVGAVVIQINGTAATDLATARGALRNGRNRFVINAQGFNRIITLMIQPNQR